MPWPCPSLILEGTFFCCLLTHWSFSSNTNYRDIDENYLLEKQLRDELLSLIFFFCVIEWNCCCFFKVKTALHIRNVIMAIVMTGIQLGIFYSFVFYFCSVLFMVYSLFGDDLENYCFYSQSQFYFCTIKYMKCVGKCDYLNCIFFCFIEDISIITSFQLISIHDSRERCFISLLQRILQHTDT